MLHDCPVCGVNDMRIQCRLLAEPEPLTFKRAFEVAQGIETAERHTKDLVTRAYCSLLTAESTR